MGRLALLAVVFSVGCGGAGAQGSAAAEAVSAHSSTTSTRVAGSNSGVDASPSASASAALVAPNEPSRPCPPVTPRQPISFSATPWRLPANAVDRPVLFSAEKDGERLLAPIVGAIDRAVKDCGVNCHARCEVAKNDGQLFGVHCSVVRPSGEVKFFGRDSAFTFRRDDSGWHAIDIPALSRTKGGVFEDFTPPDFVWLGDDQIFYGNQGTYGPNIGVLEGREIRDKLACDQVLTTDAGVGKAALSHGMRGDDEADARGIPVFHGDTGDRAATATALNADLAGARNLGVSVGCHVLTSTPELVSVLCADIDGIDVPATKLEASDPPSAVGFTYRLAKTHLVTLAELTAKLTDAPTIIASQCFPRAQYPKMKSPPKLTADDLAAFAVTIRGAAFAVDYTEPGAAPPSGRRTKICLVPWSALETTMAAVAGG